MSEGAERPEDDERRPDGDDLGELRKEIQEAGEETPDREPRDDAEGEGAKSSGTEDANSERSSDGDLEEFRKELPQEGERDESDAGHQEAAKGADEEEPTAPAPEDEKVDDADKLTKEELEEFRRQALEEYGRERLGEDTLEGQPYNLAKEEIEAGAESESKAEGDAEGKAADNSDKEAAGGGKEAATGEEAKDGKEADAVVEAKPPPEGSKDQVKPDEEKVEVVQEGEATPKAVEVYNQNDDQIVVIEQLKPGGPEGPPQPEVETPGLQRLQADQTEFGKQFAPGEVFNLKAESDPGPKNSSSVQTRDIPDTSLSVIGSNEVGRYSLEGKQTVVTGSEGDSKRADKLEPEGFSCTAVKYMRSTALLLPESKIPEHTKDDVIMVHVAREREDWKAYNLYCRETPGAGKGYIDLRQLNAELHERFVITRAEVLQTNTFVNEYNARKPNGLENTELVRRDQGLVLKADGKEVPMSVVALRSQEGRAVIDAMLGNGQVKIANGIGESEIRLKDHSRVTEIKATSEGVILSYQRTGHDPYPHRRIVMEGAPESPHFAKREGPLLVGRIDVESRSYGRDSIEFKLRASDTAYEHIFNNLAECGNPDAFKKLKGDTAEEIVKRLGPDLGMTIRADHPFNEDPLKTGSERSGPDLLVSFGDSEELAYVEIKWWAYKAGAAKEAESQVLADLHEHPTSGGKKVSGAYIAILDWNSENEWFTITLKRVGPVQLEQEP